MNEDTQARLVGIKRRRNEVRALSYKELEEQSNEDIDYLLTLIQNLEVQFRVTDSKRVTEACNSHGPNVAVFYCGDECPLCDALTLVEQEPQHCAYCAVEGIPIDQDSAHRQGAGQGTVDDAQVAQDAVWPEDKGHGAQAGYDYVLEMAQLNGFNNVSDAIITAVKASTARQQGAEAERDKVRNGYKDRRFGKIILLLLQEQFAEAREIALNTPIDQDTEGPFVRAERNQNPDDAPCIGQGHNAGFCYQCRRFYD